MPHNPYYKTLKHNAVDRGLRWVDLIMLGVKRWWKTRTKNACWMLRLSKKSTADDRPDENLHSPSWEIGYSQVGLELAGRLRSGGLFGTRGDHLDVRHCSVGTSRES